MCLHCLIMCMGSFTYFLFKCRKRLVVVGQESLKTAYDIYLGFFQRNITIFSLNYAVCMVCLV